MSGKLIIVQGAQYGSEGKGQEAAIAARQFGARAVIRTGSSNAGHSVVINGVKHVTQLLPTVAYDNPEVLCVLGPGAYIDPQLLIDECSKVVAVTGKGTKARVFVDKRAGLLVPAHAHQSTKSGRSDAMGSTGKGGSSAIIDKMDRRGNIHLWKGTLLQSWMEENHHKAHILEQMVTFCDTSEFVHGIFDAGGVVVIEAAQGTLLDFNLGEWPFVTSRATSPWAWMAEAGVGIPKGGVHVRMVVRTFPIRVAGNSGNLPHEMNWCRLMDDWNIRRIEKGLEPLVDAGDIHEFETALRIKAEAYDVPWNIEAWSVVRGRVNPDHLAVMRRYQTEALNHVTDVGNRVGEFVEKTTVTKLVRRIGKLDHGDLHRAGVICSPRDAVVTFLNYQFPEYWNETDADKVWNDPEVLEYLHGIEKALGCQVVAVTTGPAQGHHLRGFVTF